MLAAGRSPAGRRNRSRGRPRVSRRLPAILLETQRRFRIASQLYRSTFHPTTQTRRLVMTSRLCVRLGVLVIVVASVMGTAVLAQSPFAPAGNPFDAVLAKLDRIIQMLGS